MVNNDEQMDRSVNIFTSQNDRVLKDGLKTHRGLMLGLDSHALFLRLN